LNYEPDAPPPVKQLHEVLDHGAAQAIADAVTEAERQTTAEIVVRLAAISPEGNIRAIAEAEFVRVGLGALQLRNGVLIYVSLNRRAVEVVVGPEAARLIPQEIWQRAVDAASEGFAAGDARRGILSAIDIITPALAKAFPPGETDLINLPNVTEDQ
jgi:uncharacterized membrane protein